VKPPARLEFRLRYPAWVNDGDWWAQAFPTDEAKAGLAIELSRRNVERDSGGPFGAAVFDDRTGGVLSVGVNLVVPSRSSVMHAEVVALLMAQQRLGRYRLNLEGPATYTLASSCDPCAMCLGAINIAGVSRLIAAADAEDARALGFDEGPVFAESWAYLERAGVTVMRGVSRAAARAVLERYRKGGGEIYAPNDPAAG